MANGLVFTTGSSPKRLWPGIKTWYGMEYERYVDFYSKIFDIEKSTRAYEEDVKLTNMGLAQVLDQGNMIKYDSFDQGYVSRYIHVQYAKGFAITQIALDDDQYAPSLVKKATMELSGKMQITKDIVFANVLNNGFGTTAPGSTGGDGVALFSASHPLADGGVASNILTTPLALSEAALEQATIQIGQFVDEAGIIMAARESRLVVPLALQYQAARILKNVDRPATADRDINALVRNGRFPEDTVVDPYLTSSTAWFIKTDVANGLKGYMREGIMLESDNDFNTGNVLFKITERYVPYWSDFRGAFASAGA